MQVVQNFKSAVLAIEFRRVVVNEGFCRSGESCAWNWVQKVSLTAAAGLENLGSDESLIKLGVSRGSLGFRGKIK